MFCKRPVERLSSPRTRLPRAKSASTRCEPMNPAAPVTSQVAGSPSLELEATCCSCRCNSLGPARSVDGWCPELGDPSPTRTPIGGHGCGHVASVNDQTRLLHDPIPVV